MNIYKKDYLGIYCSGGFALMAANTGKEATETLNAYSKKNHRKISYDPKDFDRSVKIKNAEYHGKKAKILHMNVVQE